MVPDRRHGQRPRRPPPGHDPERSDCPDGAEPGQDPRDRPDLLPQRQDRTGHPVDCGRVRDGAVPGVQPRGVLGDHFPVPVRGHVRRRGPRVYDGARRPSTVPLREEARLPRERRDVRDAVQGAVQHPAHGHLCDLLGLHLQRAVRGPDGDLREDGVVLRRDGGGRALHEHARLRAGRGDAEVGADQHGRRVEQHGRLDRQGGGVGCVPLRDGPRVGAHVKQAQQRELVQDEVCDRGRRGADGCWRVLQADEHALLQGRPDHVLCLHPRDGLHQLHLRLPRPAHPHQVDHQLGHHIRPQQRAGRHNPTALLHGRPLQLPLLDPALLVQPRNRPRVRLAACLAAGVHVVHEERGGDGRVRAVQAQVGQQPRADHCGGEHVRDRGAAGRDALQRQGLQGDGRGSLRAVEAEPAVAARLAHQDVHGDRLRPHREPDHPRPGRPSGLPHPHRLLLRPGPPLPQALHPQGPPRGDAAPAAARRRRRRRARARRGRARRARRV
mmetsp:Transcript_276/g.689  ORF Transcript_276/g.689 Transcript_276/m.689 type:complete len:497 (+) Transcript_276:276-1766(+)